MSMDGDGLTSLRCQDMAKIPEDINRPWPTLGGTAQKPGPIPDLQVLGIETDGNRRVGNHLTCPMQPLCAVDDAKREVQCKRHQQQSEEGDGSCRGQPPDGLQTQDAIETQADQQS